jgi:hypothetical protein
VGLFREYLPVPPFYKTFFQSVPVILWHRAVSMPFLAANAHFLQDAKTPPPWFPSFPCNFDMFGLHPDVAVANLSRPN